MAEGTHVPIRKYLTVWGWLFILSALAYFIDVMHVPAPWKAILLVAVALMKAGMIMAVFMHLGYERLSLIYAVVAPLIFLLVMTIAFLPEGIAVLNSHSIVAP
jgi:caa(3)-type oxidase subunit IV